MGSACLEIDSKDGRDDRKSILMLKRRLAQSDLPIVNEGAVAAAQVAYSQPMTIEGQDTMMATRAPFNQPQLAVECSADEQSPFGDRHNRAG